MFPLVLRSFSSPHFYAGLELVDASSTTLTIISWLNIAPPTVLVVSFIVCYLVSATLTPLAEKVIVLQSSLKAATVQFVVGTGPIDCSVTS